jgi:hypothetical protein
MAASSFDHDMRRLEVELKQLEAEYNMYFAGRLAKPPWETRGRVEALLKQYDRGPLLNTSDRFRFSTLQSRFSTFAELWDRGMRAREEGRPSPFASVGTRKSSGKGGPPDRILYVAAFRDPGREIDKLTELYDSLAEARREVGQEAVPFHRFAELIRTQVKQLRQSGSTEVAFRVAVKSGKVAFTARAMKSPVPKIAKR